MIASDVVAARIRELRKKRGWTAQQLADRCTELGAPELTAASISNIETGRRDKSKRRTRTITVDEALALAYALDAPFALLFVPLEAEELPITPKLSIHPGDVAAWFSGDAAPNPERESEWVRTVGVLSLYAQVRQWVDKAMFHESPEGILRDDVALEALIAALNAAAEAGQTPWVFRRDWYEFLRPRVKYPVTLRMREDDKESSDG